jgi:hypothetical protein
MTLPYQQYDDHHMVPRETGGEGQQDNKEEAEA